jgi:hypothetical protein
MANVVRTDRMAGTSVPSLLVSARYQVSNVDTAIENGSIVELKGLMEGQRELYIANKPTAGATLGKLALVAAPEICYEANKRRLSDFTNEAGSNIRCYILHSGDIFSVSKAGVDGSIAVGAKLAVQAALKLKVDSAGTFGQIIAIENDMVVIQVA